MNEQIAIDKDRIGDLALLGDGSSAEDDVYYSNTIRLVLAYYDAYREHTHSIEKRLITELCIRLRQLSYLHNLIGTDNAEMIQENNTDVPSKEAGNVTVSTVVHLHTIDHPDSLMQPLRQDERLHLNLEAFYYIAHRIRKLLQTAGEGLPGIGRFECPPIAKIRNNLIEHSAVKTISLCLSNQGGPFLKGARRDDELAAYRDKGFTQNAAAFRSALNEWFKKALTSVNRQYR